jgi:hypothetical protein
MRTSPPRSERISLLFTVKEREQLEALALRDGQTMTSVVAGLVARAWAIGLADGSLRNDTLAHSSPPPLRGTKGGRR